MNLDFCSLFSGSTGNSELVAFDDTLLLIDAGRTGKALDEAVRRQGFDMRMVRAILVTHEHIDHIRGVGVLARKYGMEVYASHGTWEAMADKVGEIPARQRCEFDPDADFYIDKVNVLPFSIPHDAAQPTGFSLTCGGKKGSVMTDLGAGAIAVQRVGGQIESLSWNTADGFGAALNAFMGQNYGARKTDRIRKGSSGASFPIRGTFPMTPAAWR